MGNLNDYFALSPRNDLDVRKDDLDKKIKDTKQINYDHYQEKLKWALTNSNRKNIKNIAVTGYYGSGKSSILKTFIKRHDEKTLDDRKLKFLELSLATFNNKKNGQENNDTDQIEKSLLQQIFYKVKDQEIPYSKFKKTGYGKPFFNQWHLSFLTGFIILLFVRLYLYFFDIDNLDQYVYNTIDGLAFGLLSLFIITKIGSLNRFGFKKLSYLNIDLEISKADGENDLSVLSRFLNEIIYFFKQTQFNVVLIEDIDRFDNTEIFSNLRELNFILNSSDLIKDDIIFIYAIKNEQFNSATDRTKFFDFIIPVIPVVNYETSASFFIDKMKASHIDINELMVKRLFMLVDDVRVINNTYNELITYKRILGKEGIDENNNQEQFYGESLVNKLFPLLFYKNAEPKDFSKLLKENGLLYETLNKVDEIKQKKIKCIEEEIDEEEKEIEKVKESPFNTYNELEQHILFQIFKILSVKHNDRWSVEIEISVENSRYNLNQVEAIDIDRIIKTGQVNYKIQNTLYKLSMEKIENELGYKIKQRLDNYKKRTPVENINQSKARHLKELNDIKDTPPHRLISFSELKNIHEERKDKSKEGCYSTSQLKIIETLILNGYVDKDYFIYLSDYSDLGISRNDFDFLLRVRDQSITKFDLDIHTPDEINYRLKPSDYNSPAILNFDYANFLFSNKGEILDEDRILFCKQLAKLDVLEVDFLIAYISKCLGVNKFIKTLSETQPKLWYNIRNENRFNDDIQKRYFIALIKHASIQNIKIQAENSDLIAYLYQQDDFLSIADSNRLKDIINTLELKLSKIDFNSDKGLLEFIYENNAYTINKENVYGFYYYFSNSTDKIKKRALTELFDPNGFLHKMKEYVCTTSKLDTYIKKLVLEVPTNDEEIDDVLLQIINYDDNEVDVEIKVQMLKMHNFKLKDVTYLNNYKFKLACLKEDIMFPKWKNILELYECIFREENNNEQQVNLLKYLITFINLHTDELVKDDFNKGNEKLYEITEVFFSHEDLIDSNIDKLIDFFNLQNKNIFTNQLLKASKERIQYLIDKSYFTLNDENLKILHENDEKGLAIRLLQNQGVKNMKVVDDLEINEYLVNASLKFKSKKLKEKVVNNYLTNIRPETLSDTNDNVINAIAKNYAQNNFHIESANQKKFKNTSLDDSNAIKLLNKIFYVLEKQEIKDYLLSMNNDKFKDLVQKNKRPSIPLNQENEKLLNKLKEAKLISSYKRKNNNYRVYKFEN